jgi:hypothetical protein
MIRFGFAKTPFPSSLSSSLSCNKSLMCTISVSAIVCGTAGTTAFPSVQRPVMDTPSSVSTRSGADGLEPIEILRENWGQCASARDGRFVQNQAATLPLLAIMVIRPNLQIKIKQIYNHARNPTFDLYFGNISPTELLRRRSFLFFNSFCSHSLSLFLMALTPCAVLA